MSRREISIRFISAMMVACILVGCGSKPEEAPSPPKKEAEVSKPIPTDPAPSASKPKGNPNRVYQLADLQEVEIKVDGNPIRVWVMDNEPKCQEGMMFLEDKDVPDKHGMIFLFSKEQTKDNGFWMENTLIPLDIVYVSAAGKVVDVLQGKPLDRTTLRPSGSYQSVIEFKKGEAGALGIKPGSQVEIPPGAKAKE